MQTILFNLCYTPIIGKVVTLAVHRFISNPLDRYDVLADHGMEDKARKIFG